MRESNGKKVCDICGKGFEQKVYWQRHCSKSCRQATWALGKLRKKEKCTPEPRDRLEKILDAER